MSKVKKLISVTLIALLIFAIIPLSAFAGENGITQKINELRTVYDTAVTGIYFTSDGKLDDGISGSRCKLSNIPARGILPSGRDVAKVTGESWSCLAFANYAFYYIFGSSYKSNKTVSSPSFGDFVEIKRRYSQGDHYGIYLYEDSNYIYLYNGNGNRSKNEATYEDGFSKSRWYISSVRHASNYNEVANSVSKSAPASLSAYKLGEYITNEPMFLRATPNGTKVFDGTIPRGTKVKVTELFGVWGKVIYQKYSGWMSLEYSTYVGPGNESPENPITPPAAPFTTGIYVTNDALYFRNQPSSTASSYFTIPKGTELRVTGVSGDWGKAFYKGTTGWLYLSYCSKIASIVEEAPQNLRAEWLVIDVYEGDELTAADWQKIKAAGVKGAIIRVGGRYVRSKELYTDDMFLQHYNNAKAAGLYVGAYFFSYALTQAQAVEEANAVINTLKKYNCKLEMPVFIDMEDYAESDGRDTQHYDAGKNVCTMVADTFCKTVENAGYYAGLYCSKAFAADLIDPKILTDRAVWIAHYGVDRCGYGSRYDMWQYTPKGAISGLSDVYDMNYCYVNLPILVSDFANEVYAYADVDGNGAVTAADARLALRAAVGLESVSKASKTAADIDCNGTVSAADARTILRIAVGLENANELQKQFA